MSTQPAVSTVVPPTAPPTTYAEADAAWKARRRTFVGGSELYQLFNIPQYGKGCARQLGYIKSGYAPEHDFSPEDEALFKRGHLMEPLAASLYEEKTGRKVRRPPMDEFGFSKVRRHPDYPFLGVHTDRTILAGHGDVTETGDLELKSHGEGYWWRIQREGLPLGHVLQVQHTLLVNGRSWGSCGMIGVFGSLPLEYADTKADTKVHDEIKKAGYTFWNALTKGELPPPLPDKDDMRCQACPFRQECRGEEVDAAALSFMRKNADSDKELVQITDPDLTADVTALMLMQNECKALDNDPDKPSDNNPLGAIQMIKEKITRQLIERGIVRKEKIKDADIELLDWDKKPFFPGVCSIALIPNKSRAWFDETKLKADHPDIHTKYVRLGGTLTGSVQLRIYPAVGSKGKK